MNFKALIDTNGKAVIPYGVTRIEGSAFSGCTGLTSIEIPDSVTEIGGHAFEGCSGLTSIEIPDSVTEIGDDAFYGCTGLTSIIISDNNERFCSIDNCCLSKDGHTLIFGCTSSIIPSTVTKIVDGAFRGCTGLTSIEIPDSVTEIGWHAFYGCNSLTSIEIPDSVTGIGQSAFSGCTGLTSIKLPTSLTYLADYAFEGCTGLTSIDIQDSVTGIGWGAFSGCTGLTSIKLPTSLTYLEDDAFHGCTGLTSIEIPDSVTEIGRQAFNGCTGLKSIEIPDSVTKIGDLAFEGCTGLTSIIVSDNNKWFCSIDNCCLSKDGHTLIFGCKSSIIPNTVTIIESNAFADCTGLTGIEIPDSVMEIKSYAFTGCTGLTNIIIRGSFCLNNKEYVDNENYVVLPVFGCPNVVDIYIDSKTPSEIEQVINAILTYVEDNQVTLHVPVGTGYAYRHRANFCRPLKDIIADYNPEKHHKKNISAKHYLFFDTETAGLPLDFNAPTSDTDNWPRLVQLSWIVQDEKGNTISKEDHIIKPDGFTIPETATRVHGITTDKAMAEGEDLKAILTKFLDEVSSAKVLVCHNANFDKSIIGCECIRLFGKDSLKDKEFRDTMMESIKFCALTPLRNGEYKWPKLQELHNKLFGYNFDDAHNSNADVEATAKCFWELIRRNVIKASN